MELRIELKEELKEITFYYSSFKLTDSTDRYRL